MRKTFSLLVTVSNLGSFLAGFRTTPLRLQNMNSFSRPSPGRIAWEMA